MKRFASILNRAKSQDNSTNNAIVNAPVDSPEGNAIRAIRLFCESGSNSNSNGGEEVLHLPVIVDAAESSPAAAAASAQQIRKFLAKEWAAKPQVQYHAIMLLRILSDNPGPTFTRNFDKQFVSTVKDLLRHGKDASVQQMLRETLDSLEMKRNTDDSLQPLLQMWRREKGQAASLTYSRSVLVPPPASMGATGGGGGFWQQAPSVPPPGQQQYQSVYGNSTAGQSRRTQLPPAVELAGRVEEAKNTANILLQLLQSTPSHELLTNELVKECSERCQTAQKSMQGYINVTNPPPDDDTMLTLIETNEQLSLAISRYQRAILAARRNGRTPSPNPAAMNGGQGSYSDPSPLSQSQSLFVPSPAPQFAQPEPQNPYPNGRSLFAAPIQRTPPQENNYVSYPSQTTTQQPYSNFAVQSDTPPQSIVAPISHPGPRTVPFSDPFADPVEYSHNPPPLAFEPTNYGSIRRPAPASPPPAPQRTSRVFSIDSENAFATAGDSRRSIVVAAESYPNQQTNTNNSPGLSARTPSLPTPVSPENSREASPQQHKVLPPLPEMSSGPSPGAYHQPSASLSYLGRQESAANGLTMHGAAPAPAEIDSHSDVGRRDRDRPVEVPSPSNEATVTPASSSAFEISPTEVHTPQTARRVDVAGTGGFRNSITGVRA